MVFDDLVMMCDLQKEKNNRALPIFEAHICQNIAKKQAP